MEASTASERKHAAGKRVDIEHVTYVGACAAAKPHGSAGHTPLIAFYTWHSIRQP